MNLNNIVIVLSRPEESRNIGAVCRAMANSGISCLRIVGKKEDIDEERVR
ncbi:MAG: RNA methyltransferase, partial [Treponema sp.]|nr:RNA methyltransferase [Treponema sp.]